MIAWLDQPKRPPLDPAAEGFWAAKFHPWSGTHLAAVAVCVLIAGVLIALGRRGYPGERERRARRVGCVVCLALWVAINAVYMRSGDFSRVLPLQLCDLASLLAPLALWSERRVARGVLYFWAFALSSQAFIQPTLTRGPADYEFWAFWTSHLIIVGGAAYDLIARRFRPTLREYGLMVLITSTYIALVFLLDWRTGWNYGYVGPIEPTQKTVIQKLGTWPGRVIWICVLGLVATFLVYLPWGVAAWMSRRRAAEAAPRA